MMHKFIGTKGLAKIRETADSLKLYITQNKVTNEINFYL